MLLRAAVEHDRTKQHVHKHRIAQVLAQDRPRRSIGMVIPRVIVCADMFEQALKVVGVTGKLLRNLLPQ